MYEWEQPGIGGGLCNLANTIHLLILHSPLDFHFLKHLIFVVNIPICAATQIYTRILFLDYLFATLNWPPAP